jgi:hypothetical protein
MRVFLLKSVKVRVKSKKKGEKIEKNEEKLEEIAKSED